MSDYQVTNYGMCGECKYSKRDWTNPKNPDFYCSNERSDNYGYNTDYAVCDECGGMNIRMTSHFDGRDIYGYDYRCECGAHIRRTIKRRADEVWE